MAIFGKNKKNSRASLVGARKYSGAMTAGKKTARRGVSRFLFWVLLIMFFGVLAYLLFFSPQLEMSLISVEGNQEITRGEIEKTALEATEGKYLRAFSKRNFFFLRKRTIIEALENEFSRLEVLSVQKKFPNSLEIFVKERQTELVWCSGGVFYSVDKSGLVFSGLAKSEEELKNDRFLAVIDDNAKPVEIGTTMLHEEFVEYLKKLDYLLKEELKMEIDGFFHTPALASQEVFAKIKEPESEGWFLKLQSVVSAEETKKILETVFEKELDSGKRKNLEYLDLRVKGKVYYKSR